MRHRLNERDLAGRGVKRADGRHAFGAAGKLDGHDAGAVREQHQGLRLAEDVRQLRRSFFHGRVDRQDHAGLVDKHEGAVLGQGARRHILRQALELSRGLRAVGRRTGRAELRGRERRDDVDVVDGVEKRVLAAVADLDPGAASKRDEKQDQEGRDCEPQQRLILLKPSIGRVRV